MRAHLLHAGKLTHNNGAKTKLNENELHFNHLPSHVRGASAGIIHFKVNVKKLLWFCAFLLYYCLWPSRLLPHVFLYCRLGTVLRYRLCYYLAWQHTMWIWHFCLLGKQLNCWELTMVHAFNQLQCDSSQIYGRISATLAITTINYNVIVVLCGQNSCWTPATVRRLPKIP